MRRKHDSDSLHLSRYRLAFLSSDASGMDVERRWFAEHSEVQDVFHSAESDTETYAGRLGKAREMTRGAVDSAIRADSKETGASWWKKAAVREAAFGNFNEARQAAEAGLKLNPDSRRVQVQAALAYAISGDTLRARAMADELNKRYPLDTQMQSLRLPAIHAQLALNQKKPMEAIEQLQRALPPIEYSVDASCLYTLTSAGRTYREAGQSKEAAAEFQKILDHGGLVWNCWTPFCRLSKCLTAILDE